MFSGLPLNRPAVVQPEASALAWQAGPEIMVASVAVEALAMAAGVAPAG